MKPPVGVPGSLARHVHRFHTCTTSSASRVCGPVHTGRQAESRKPCHTNERRSSDHATPIHPKDAHPDPTRDGGWALRRRLVSRCRQLPPAYQGRVQRDLRLTARWSNSADPSSRHRDDLASVRGGRENLRIIGMVLGRVRSVRSRRQLAADRVVSSTVRQNKREIRNLADLDEWGLTAVRVPRGRRGRPCRDWR